MSPLTGEMGERNKGINDDGSSDLPTAKHPGSGREMRKIAYAAVPPAMTTEVGIGKRKSFVLFYQK
jgi:hypothetical protein